MYAGIEVIDQHSRALMNIAYGIAPVWNGTIYDCMGVWPSQAGFNATYDSWDEAIFFVLSRVKGIEKVQMNYINYNFFIKLGDGLPSQVNVFHV